MKNTLKYFCVIIMSAIIFNSCNNSKEELVPNFFKHGMKGRVESVFTEVYKVTNGLKGEKWPRNYITLWGDKFEGDSFQKFDHNGNILEKTNYIDWATYCDTIRFTYEYEENRLISDCAYTDGKLSEWCDKSITLNEHNQISEINYTSYMYGNIKISRREIYNDNGVLIEIRNGETNRLEIKNTLNADGYIIKEEEFGSSPQTSKCDTVIYTKFDAIGNWTERLIIDKLKLNEDTLLQCRTIKYFK